MITYDFLKILSIVFLPFSSAFILNVYYCVCIHVCILDYWHIPQCTCILELVCHCNESDLVKLIQIRCHLGVKPQLGSYLFTNQAFKILNELSVNARF